MSFSQLTEKVIHFTNQLKIVDSLKVVRKYKNGSLKETYTILTYEYADYAYETKINSHIYYSKKTGRKILVYQYDSFGFLQNSEFYTDEGKLYKEVKVLKIETKANTIDEFVKSDKYLVITAYEKNFNADDSGKLVLTSEGKRINNKKIGLWKVYRYDRNCNYYLTEKNYN